VTVAVSWTCAAKPDVDEVNPGKCPDGAPMIARRTPRAHGNHNPRHGGIFFMAPDNWHHLEGTYPAAGLFRLHLYDDFARPLPPERIVEASGRLITKEEFDTGTGTMREVSVFMLERAGEGRYMEARLDDLPLPAEMIVKIRLKPDGPEHRFDFVFPELSRDNEVATVTGGMPAVEIPDTTAEIIALLSSQSEDLGRLIQRGAFGEIYVPAFQAKDLALALDLRVKDLAPERRAGVTAAIERVVRSAWQLDAYGDQGNRELIEQTYSGFARSVEELKSAFAPFRR
jgi:hypothetical protein